jgi:hypothetical protein
MAQPGERELQLLLDYTAGKKTAEQVQADARTFRRGNPELQRLVDSNASRGVNSRLQELTGISSHSLHRSEVTFSDGRRMHPFILPSTHVAKLVEADVSCFEVAPVDAPPGVVASSFVASPEYKEHPLVQQLSGIETVVPMGFYPDGVAVGQDIHTDSLYCVYVYFLHATDSGHDSKHVVTVHRKSEAIKDTINDLFAVLVWDLRALAQGRHPHKDDTETEFQGKLIGGNWGEWHRVALMQVKGDWSYYCEALGVRQWNGKEYMCPFCRASRDGERSWKDFSLDAAWLKMTRNHERFLEDVALSEANRFNQHSPFTFRCKLFDAPYNAVGPAGSFWVWPGYPHTK